MADSPLALGPTQIATTPNAATGAARLAAGTLAGEYVVEHFLGAGAMGEVYAGKHPVIGKRVAIKVLKLSLASSAEAAERFLREARAVNHIDHANVIDVFAFGRLDDGRLYLVMDLVAGRTLRAAVEDGGLDVATTLDVLEQIADALDAAHARDVVHRDLKPDNVMLAGTPPKVFVLDFGIAKLGQELTGKGTLTEKGAWVGTPGYMAPEQWAAEGAGPASDRYALGVMAFELLSGKLPFQAPTLPQMMEQHFRAPVPALSTRGAVAARSTFDPVLARAMAKDPTQRYGSAKELVAALRVAAGKQLHRATLPPRRLWLPAAIGAGVLGMAVIAVVAVRGGAPEPEHRTSRAGGFATVDVRSNPPRATVLRGDRLYGTTPASFEVRIGEDVDLVITKAGYAPAHEKVTAAENMRAIDVMLVQVNGFEGTWVLPDGQLRAFVRNGEYVDVFKLATLTGEREFYRKFTLEDAPAGVVFAATETVIDQRAPQEPSCQIPVRVEYAYDAANDTLEVRPEDVETGFQHGRCVVHGRELVKPVALVRADRTTETRISRAPLGVPSLDRPQLRTRDADIKLPNNTLDDGFDVKQKASPINSGTDKRPVQNAKTKKQTSRNVQNAPDLKAPPQKAVAPPQAQTKAPPPAQQPAPQPAQQPNRGDSQVAPQVGN